jgi:hypothetical protein
VDDFEAAVATYRAACLSWPGARIRFGSGAQILEDTTRLPIKEIGPIYKRSYERWADPRRYPGDRGRGSPGLQTVKPGLPF